ncbi:MAG TPA: SIS domain-containing protein, partial [Terriglobales bacterium]|nr:SIS domain-containing protein [Terriglobales bacterium]
MRHIGENVVRIEAAALKALADRLAGPMAKAFEQAVEMLYGCGGRVVVTGMGKSGLVARKVAATLSSTGTPALFLHPAEAVHGDLGMLVRGDVVLALSSSGETEEIVALLPTIKRLGLGLIAMTGDSLNGKAKLSTLAQAADVALDCSVAQEACSLGLAPTASTTTMLALGDALALALAEKRGFK